MKLASGRLDARHPALAFTSGCAGAAAGVALQAAVPVVLLLALAGAVVGAAAAVRLVQPWQDAAQNSGFFG